MKKFAVFGNPIAHSLSPTIHQMFAKVCDEVIAYEKILAPVDGFEGAIQQFFADPDALGCNVTVPFKTEAFQLACSTDREAKAARAVNTLVKLPGGEFQGYNTDGMGLVADLLANGVSLTDKKVLLLGAGGAARGVILPLLGSGISRLGISNRTVDKARAIVDELAQPNLECVEKSALIDWQADIIINSTSASLHNSLPGIEAGAFEHCQVAYDMAYAKEPTVFMLFARQHGCEQAFDGLGMLVEQAAASFNIWTGKTPDTAEVVKRLREQYAAV